MTLTATELEVVLLSLKVAAVATAGALVPGVALGWLLARRRFFGYLLVDATVHLPLVLPPVVVGYLLLRLFGRQGPLGAVLRDTLGVELAFTWLGAALAAGIMGLPLLVRSVRLAVELVDTRLEDAARTLGASPMRVFWTITLPLSLPGVITGLLLAFARSLGEFGATITFAGNLPGQTRTLPVAIYGYSQVPGGDEPATRLVVLAILLSVAALVASELVTRRLRRSREG